MKPKVLKSHCLRSVSFCGCNLVSSPSSLIRLLLFGSLALSTAATAATSTWDGGGADANWSTAANWAGDSAPVSGNDLVFAGFVGTSAANNLDTATAGTFLVNSITFASGADQFSLSGNNLNLSGKTVTNNSDILQSIEAKIEANNGFTVNTSAVDRDVYLTGSINTTTGFNKAINKNGAGKLIFNGTQNTSWALNVNAGTMQVYNGNNAGQVLGFSASIAAGATLATENSDVLHGGSSVQINGLLDLGAAEEQLGVIYGTGIVTNHGDGVGVTLLRMARYGSNNGIDTGTTRTWSGTIQYGTEPTAVQIEGNKSRTVTFAGANTYTGNTTFTSTTDSLILANTGSLAFKIGANGVSTRITATTAQTTATTTFNGIFNIDLSGAEMIHNNQWTLVDAAKLNETYSATFSVAAPFSKTATGVWTYTDGSNNTWTFTEATGVLRFQVPAGRPPVTIWSGAGSDANWSTAANWNVEVLSGDDLLFTGSTRLGNTNNLATAWDTVNSVPGAVTIKSFKFDASAGAFTLGGNEIYYDNKTILNQSAATQTVNVPIRATAGFTVDTSAGDVVLGGSLGTTASFNKPLTKTGTGKLVLNGTQSTSWALNVNAGTMQVFNPNTGGQVAGYTGNIAAGAALLAESGDVFHSSANVLINGTLDLGASEQLGVIRGNGVVTNHGLAGGTTTLRMNALGLGDGYTWNGTIKDGGNVTAVGIEGTTGRTVQFSGSNTYTGDTTILQPSESFTLASGGSLKLKPGANGVSNKITATTAQSGTTTLDGRLILDLSGANITNSNSWPLVDVTNLNETFGSNFQLVNSAYVPPTAYTINAGAGTFGGFGEDNGFVSGGSDFNSSNTIDLSSVTNPAPTGVYQTERYGNSTYTFPGLGAGATYTVRLHFAEVYWGNVGQRVFNVLINGTTVLPNYDIVAAAGSINKAVVQEIPVTATPGGTITIQFVTLVDNAKINGIEILPIGGGSGANFSETSNVWTMVDGSKTWTFSEATGMLSLAVAGSGGYSIWATANGISGQPASGDFDNDGLTNLMEYALGKDPKVSSTPAGTYNGNLITFTKGTEAIANGDVSWTIQKSNDLGISDPWSTVVTQPAADPAATISYTLPSGLPKVFVRLRANGQ
ncbi:MAG: malectin domain-containing carbohydrate-binding protein [Luteolibacter sp.]|uniref:malectin domain-containing carbohydrate-binding protein n=1 Tax=Luteolibacter sp. TaxID=1962973 RepID=UPI003267B90A